MIIHGFQKMTLLDFPGRVACTVFTAGCNFRCPFCHNAGLVTHLDAAERIALLKIVGICFTAEIASLICEDSGNAALGKALQSLAGAVILYLSLPMLTKLLDLVEGILENL